ncbi:hypothetical protein BSKO_04564 [Bryopsis sp. KO-2023]|nr:hypothetical protein BSKO_04564 [Bryopsis sp. KO-2023]
MIAGRCWKYLSWMENDCLLRVYPEGTHLLIPWFKRPIIYDVRAKPGLINSTSGGKDLQMVNISLRVLTRPNQAKLPELYRQLGTDYAERVLPSIIQDGMPESRCLEPR